MPVLRVLLVSDLHHTLPQLDWVVRAAPRFDPVALAGDSLDANSAVPLDVQCVVVLRYLHRLQQAGRVAVCWGNHDLTGPDAHGEQAALWLAEAQLAADAHRDAARWVWVYHWPPLGSSICWTGRRNYGNTHLGGWIDRHQPDAVLTGHVHEPPFKPAGSWADKRGRNWIFNAGRQIEPVSTHIEIDLDGGSARWRSMMGEESLRLADAAAPARSVFKYSGSCSRAEPSWAAPARPAAATAGSAPPTPSTARARCRTAA